MKSISLDIQTPPEARYLDLKIIPEAPFVSRGNTGCLGYALLFCFEFVIRPEFLGIRCVCVFFARVNQLPESADRMDL